jgi:Uma2 family endonuclease
MKQSKQLALCRDDAHSPPAWTQVEQEVSIQRIAGIPRSMSTIVVEGQMVHIPPWVDTLAAFRRWTESDDFPDSGRICYLKGEVWVDMSREQVFTHNQLKNEFAFVLTGLVKKYRLGRFFPDGVLLTNLQADISVRPDGLFASTETMRTGAVRLIEGAEGGFVELEGSPDMVLEIISRSSVTKDRTTLRQDYAEAGIREYWLADVRGEQPLFEILRLGSKGYTPSRKVAGWIKSSVFNRSFRLSQRRNGLGHPEYILSVR